MKQKMKGLLVFCLIGLLLFDRGAAQADFGDGSGRYGRMLRDLKSNLYKRGGVHQVWLDSMQRTYFLPWIRDHVHATKGYKYWEKDLGSFVDFFIRRQTPSGMFYDYFKSYKDANLGHLWFTNVFDRKFYYVDVAHQVFLFRMPIEADVEYLVTEGVYNYWQTSGDTAAVRRYLPALVKGMQYMMTDPLRWSKEQLLVKRPYSIDTWDFCSEPDSLKGTDRLLYHIGNDERTPKGIMHGDNSGMYQACRQIAHFYDLLGNPSKAREWNLQAELLRQRMNALCWNGRFYSHFVPEDPVPGHINMDPVQAISLSNTYSMNRGTATPEMAQQIITRYKEVAAETKAFSKASWYGVYPFISPQFGRYKVDEYMNGAILPLVGGELVKAAFQNGEEEYAVEQLHLMDSLMDKNGRYLPGCINWDGTAQKEAIPAEWGQAAFVSALVEGLAGVVDKSSLFRTVEISPRWYFAGVRQTNVTVGYGGDGNQVKYDYRYDDKKRLVSMQLQGKYERYTLRIPIPEGSSRASGSINGKAVKVGMEKVNRSLYAVVEGNDGTQQIEVKFY